MTRDTSSLSFLVLPQSDHVPDCRLSFDTQMLFMETFEVVVDVVVVVVVKAVVTSKNQNDISLKKVIKNMGAGYNCSKK